MQIDLTEITRRMEVEIVELAYSSKYGDNDEGAVACLEDWM